MVPLCVGEPSPARILSTPTRRAQRGLVRSAAAPRPGQGSQATADQAEPRREILRSGDQVLAAGRAVESLSQLLITVGDLADTIGQFGAARIRLLQAGVQLVRPRGRLAGAVSQLARARSSLAGQPVDSAAVLHP